MQLLPQWRTEIEALTRGRIVTVPVFTDKAENVLRIPPDFAGRAVVRKLLLEESFVAQLVRAHALNVNYSGSEGVFHFILLNVAMAGDWKGSEEALLGHEYGHIWLNALGYRSPRHQKGGPAPCVVTHAGDVVQHVLIREEARRRGFDYMSFWLRNIERWIEAGGGAAKLDACQKVQLLSMHLDTTLSAATQSWPHLETFREKMRAAVPDISELAAPVETVLAGTDLWDRSLYEYAVASAIEVFQRVHDSNAGIPGVC